MKPSLPPAVASAVRSLLLLGLLAASAQGNLTIDLRATSLTLGTGSVSGDGKLVKLDGDLPAVITLQIWAQVTPTLGVNTNNIFGIQNILGSIKTEPGPTGPAVLGTMSIAQLATPFFAIGSSNGTVQELTIPADESPDLGSNSTNQGPQFFAARKDFTSDGSQVSNIHFASNLDSAGATVQALSAGYEFLMASATFTVTSLGVADGSTLLNYAAPAFVSPFTRQAIATWTDGDGAINNPRFNPTEFFTGNPVRIEAIPEPGSGGLLLLGGLGLLGARRRRCGRNDHVPSRRE